MFEYIEGEVAARGPARLVLDVHGVGYELTVPLSARFAAAGRVRAWAHLDVRETGWTLYGFPDPATRALFRALLSARGVGPAMALALLSGLAPAELLAAIGSGDLATLTRVKGVGKKKAEGIVLDLRERAPRLAAELGLGATRVSAHGTATALEDAVSALLSIGYTDKEARASVEAAAAKSGAREVEELVRAALSAT